MNETYKELIYTRWPILLTAAGLLYFLLSVIAAGRTEVPAEVSSGLIVMAIVVSSFQAIGSLLLFPYLFTFISKRLGATSQFDEVAGVTAVSMVPTLLLLVLGLFQTPGDGPVLLGSLISMGLFVYGLSQMNETPLLNTLGHTVVVWLILILGAGLLTTVLSILI